MPRRLALPIEHLSLTSSQPQQVSEAAGKIMGDVVFERLGDGNFDYDLDLSVIGSAVTWRSRSDSGFIARSPDRRNDTIELRFIEAGRCHSVTSEQDVDASAGQAYFLRPAHGHQVTGHPGLQQTGIALPFGRYAKLTALDVDDPHVELAKFAAIANFGQGPAKTLFHIARMLAAPGEIPHPLLDAPLGAALLKESLLGIFAETWPRTSSRGSVRQANLRHVRKAVDWIRAHAGERLQLEDIAQAANVSVRSLQTGFKQQYGMSPMAYVLKVRLQEVHHELLTADATLSITEIARKWGFANRGEFAARYRALYGETPSETRSRGRA